MMQQNATYSDSKLETISNARDSDYAFKSIQTTIISNKKNHLEKVHSVINHNIDISNYSPFQQSYQIKKELDHPKKGQLRFNTLTIINILHVAFNWCLISYLNPANHHLARIRKVCKMFESKLYFKFITFPIKIRYSQN